MNKLQGEIQHLTAELQKVKTQQEQAEREIEEKTLQIKNLQLAEANMQKQIEALKGQLQIKENILTWNRSQEFQRQLSHP